MWTALCVGLLGVMVFVINKYAVEPAVSLSIVRCCTSIDLLRQTQDTETRGNTAQLSSAQSYTTISVASTASAFLTYTESLEYLYTTQQSNPADSTPSNLVKSPTVIPAAAPSSQATTLQMTIQAPPATTSAVAGPKSCTGTSQCPWAQRVKSD